MLTQYLGTCAGASIIDVFSFRVSTGLFVVIIKRRECSAHNNLSQHNVHKTLLKTFSRSAVAPHTPH